MNWNILVIKGKETNKDSVSSGEQKWKKLVYIFILVRIKLEKVRSPV